VLVAEIGWLATQKVTNAGKVLVKFQSRCRDWVVGDQIDFFRQKLNIDTDSYRDISGVEHDAAFVVAGAKGAVLQSFRDVVDRAIAEGTTLEQFRKEFDEIVERTGWEFRGDSAWRSRIILETNLRTSYAAGRYEQMQEMAPSRPYWQWRHGGTNDPRPQHLALDGKVFRHDDPFWQSFGIPPQGYGCRCSLFTLSDRDLERRGLTVEEGPQLGDRLPIPDLPGQTTAMNPPEGWGHIHGSSDPESRARLLDNITRRLDPAIAAQVRAEAAAVQRRQLISEVRQSGTEINEAAIAWIDRRQDGKVIWLDRELGLAHILEKEQDFVKRGIAAEDIASLIKETVFNGEVIGMQGEQRQRPIYRVQFKDQTTYVAITISDEGFVVGANPANKRVLRRLLGDDYNA
jgi:SPP1 gp7 family putative phage head morphogenesis protein